MDKDFSPEKRLLKIIEGSPGKPQGSSAFDVGKKLFSPAVLKSRISFFKSRMKALFRPGGISFDLKFINAFLQLGMVALGIYLGVSIKLEFDKIRKNPLDLKRSLGSEVQADTLELAPLLKPKDYYLEKTKLRNLFRLTEEESGKPVSFKEDKEREKRPSKLMEMAQGLKLVGISWSESPDAIIEDTKAQRTYFVKTGNRINDIKVEAIYKDKVILHYESDEVEIR